jgi:hypothetical protein
MSRDYVLDQGFAEQRAGLIRAEDAEAASATR